MYIPMPISIPINTAKIQADCAYKMIKKALPMALYRKPKLRRKR